MQLKLAIIILISLPLIFLLTRAFTLVSPPQSVLQTTDGRTNFLLLGMGGAGHEAPELTDTLIFLSLNPATRDVILISIPRDVWIPSLRAKINTAYFYGENKRPGGGLILAKAAAAEFLNQPIHYAAAINFAAFVQAIDLVGGIDIDVPVTFDDLKYPIPGKETDPTETNRYQRLHFDAGLHRFDGDTALKYVRSRNAEGEQGTDFARSRRQRQVITAFKDKLLSPSLLFRPSRLRALYRIFSTAVIHDFGTPDILALAKLAPGFKTDQIRSGLLDTGDTSTDRPGLLVHPPQSSRYDYQWVLVSKDPSQFRDSITNLIFSPTPPPTN